MNDLAETLRTLVAEKLRVSPQDIRGDSDLVSDLGADSLAVVELMLALEETFGISLPEDDAEHVRTFNDIVTLLSDKCEQRAAPQSP